MLSKTNNKFWLPFTSITLIMLLSINLTAQTKIILKLDDIGASNNTCNATPVMDYLMQKQIKAAYGVIAKRLDATAINSMGKYIHATNSKGEQLVEIWNHGLYHSMPDKSLEFKGTSFAFQKEHFDSADALVFKYLGVQMHSFGSPNNATDSNTIRAVSENHQYNVIMFPYKEAVYYPSLIFLNNRVDMENGTGNPEYDHFVTEYEKHQEYKNSFMVLQGHPPMWDKAKFEQFVKILEYLLARKCEFVLPGELATILKKD